MSVRNFFILAISLFAFCQGEPDCSVANQCSDLWTAKKCNAVEHCIAEDWTHLKPTGSTDDVCSICLSMVKQARDQLQSNETREELKEVLEGSCALLVLKPAVELCDKLVDELGDELVQVLASQMDPETVCTVAKLCNNRALRVAQKNSKECAHCEAFMAIAAENMKSVTVEDFKNEFLDVCRSAGGYSDACSSLGLSHFESLYEGAKTFLTRKPCEFTFLCPSNSKLGPVDPEAKDQMCPLCKTVVKDIRKQLLKVKSVEEYADKVSVLCEKLNISNGTCTQLASPSFYETLESFDGLSEFFCHVTYCKEKREADAPVWPLVPSHHSTELDVFGLMALADLLAPQVVQKETEVRPRPTIAYGDPIENPIFLSPALISKPTQNSEDCKICQEVVRYLSEPKSYEGEDRLSKLFDVPCKRVGNEDDCVYFVFRSLPTFSAAFSGGFISKQICSDLVPSCEVNSVEAPSVKTCNLCMNIMKVLKSGDSAAWGKAVEESCSNMPGKTQFDCKNLTSSFVHLSSLLQNSTESEACKFVNLCDSASLLHVQVSEVSAPSCKSCMLTVESLRDMLKKDVNDGVIEAVLTTLCDMLPHVEKRMCRDLVKSIGVQEFKRLVEKISPSTVCAELHICPKKDDSPVEIPTETEISETAKAPVSCKFCLMAVKIILDELGDNKTEDEIRKTLDGLCNYFPAETKDTCQNLIDEYTETLIDMILADFNETEICVFIKLCNPQLMLHMGKLNNVATYDVETNEIRDWDAFGTGLTTATKTVEQPSQELLRRFHEVVEDCALCEALVGVIASHKKMLKKDYNFAANAHKICSIVPKNKVKECSSLLISYGPSIVNLIVDHQIDPNEICVYIDLCDAEMQAKVNKPVSVPEPRVAPKKNDCLRGPVFWCANAENAEKCGTFLHCQETVWKTWKNPPMKPNQSL